MDRNFHTDDFERLLREKSDEFRMYPSKRIWNSIYNNIHPGRKWPSVAMSITLITALFLIGYLNTKNTSSYTEAEKNIIPQKLIAQTVHSPFTAQSFAGNASNLNQAIPVTTADKNNTTAVIAGTTSLITGIAYDKPGIGSSVVATQQSIAPGSINIENTSATVSDATNPESINQLFGFNSIPGLTAGHNENVVDGITTTAEDQSAALTYERKIVINNSIENLPVTGLSTPGKTDKAVLIIQGGNSIVEKNNLATDKKDIISTEDKNWIENYALYNRPATKKWANKLAWQLYVTPSVVYRSLYDDANFGTTQSTPPLALSANSQDINKAVSQRPSLGFEIGTGFLYSVSKIVKLKAGLQVNYTRYNSDAFQNTHPVATKLTMHDYATNSSYEEIRTTPYSNKSGLESIKLHNETFQISLPVGANVMLMGNKTLQWNIGATIQPTYVFGGKSYLISSDRRNYIKDNSMLNKWNLNAGFETFISYKAGNGITFQLGPQFRKQLFTTNSKQIAVEEKLNTYGLKFGISKTIK